MNMLKSFSLVRMHTAIVAITVLSACAKSDEDPSSSSMNSSGTSASESVAQEGVSTVFKQQGKIFELVDAKVSSSACKHEGAISPGHVSLAHGEVTSSFDSDSLSFLGKKFSSVSAERERIQGEISGDRLISFYNEDVQSNLSSMRNLEYKVEADHTATITSSVAQGEGEMSCVEKKAGPAWFGRAEKSAYQDVLLAVVSHLPSRVLCNSVAAGQPNVELEFSFGAGSIRLGNEISNVDARMNSMERLIISPEEDPRQRGLIYSFAEEQGGTWTVGLDSGGNLVQLMLLPTIGSQQSSDFGYICNLK